MNIALILEKNKYIFAIALMAIAFGLICIFPALTIRVDPSSGFRGIEMQGTDAEVHYAARVEEVRDGFISVANTFYSAPKDIAYLQPAFPEIVVSLLGSAFGLNAARSVILSQFVFGAAVFAVMLGCFAAITKRFWWSFLGVAAYLFAGFLFSGPAVLIDLIAGRGSYEFLAFARPINPQISGILFYGALWGFAAWIRSRSMRGLIAAWVLTALSFYSYVYVWTLLGAFYAIVFAVYAWKRDRTRLNDLVRFALALGAAFLPYGLNLWRTAHDPLYMETSMRMGMLVSRQPSIGLSVIALAAIPFVFRKRLGDSAWVIAALAGASLIALNQQIATGRVIVSAHYHWYFIKPVVAILLTSLAGAFVWDQWLSVRLRRIPARIGAVFALIPLLFFGLLFQFRSYQSQLPFWRNQQAASGAIVYMRDRLKPGDTVYAEGFIRDLIPVYASADVYTAQNAHMYLSSDERARDAYFFDLWLQGVTPEEAAATFPTTRRADLSSRIHAIYYREAAGAYGNMPDAEVAECVSAYKMFYDQTAESILSKYTLTHTVISKEDPRTPQLAALESRSRSVYADEAYEIREMIDNSAVQ